MKVTEIIFTISLMVVVVAAYPVREADSNRGGFEVVGEDEHNMILTVPKDYVARILANYIESRRLTEAIVYDIADAAERLKSRGVGKVFGVNKKKKKKPQPESQKENEEDDSKETDKDKDKDTNNEKSTESTTVETRDTSSDGEGNGERRNIWLY